jgi:hypothetical protein
MLCRTRIIPLDFTATLPSRFTRRAATVPEPNPLVLSPVAMAHSIIAFPPSAIRSTTDCLHGVKATAVELSDGNEWDKALWLMKRQILENQAGWFPQEELVYPIRLEWHMRGGNIPLFGGNGTAGAMWDGVIQAFSEGSLQIAMHTDYIRPLDGSGGEHL